jgi:predicted helicase
MGDIYYKNLSDEARSRMVMIESEHIDGTMPATERYQKLSWLKSVERGTQNCRILTNVRCLSEGVDVPSLDAVIFLSPRNSQVDVVQSVGRVMRRAPDKKYGYIIIPVVIPSDADTKKALDNNKEYAVVWTVLNALRAHDDRFNATVNKIELNRNKPQNILVGAPSYGSDDDVIDFRPEAFSDVELKLSLKFEEMQALLYAKMVEKVGDRRYWEHGRRILPKLPNDTFNELPNWLPPTKSTEKLSTAFSKVSTKYQSFRFRNRSHRNACPAYHHPAGVRSAFRKLFLRSQQSYFAIHAASPLAARRGKYRTGKRNVAKILRQCQNTCFQN